MQITALHRKGRTNMYNVYIDGVDTFTCSADTVLAEGRHVGATLDAGQLQRCQVLATVDQAYRAVVAYGVRRRRSCFEFRLYCKRKGYDQELSDRLLERLERIGLADDQQFALAWVRNRRLAKPVSNRRLSLELQQK